MRRGFLSLLTSVILAANAGGLMAQDPAMPPGASPFDAATKGTKKVEGGLFTMYYKDQQLLVDVSPGHLGQNFIVLASIAKGVSQGDVLGGMSWGFGDDVIWTFNKSGEKLQVLRRNVRFKANPGSPESTAVKLAYNDSILYALPIITTTPSGGMLVDMTRIFFSDDLQIGRSLGMSFAPDRSTWAKVKVFPNNAELQVAAVYAGGFEFDTVADPRGAQINVHYSISRLPSNGYSPRVADDRVGYFMSVLKDFSDKKDDEQFVRLINRWNLQKLDPGLKLSPPKEPIKFWIEKTVPVGLRPHVRAGIEEWNKAFEKLGFSNAIEVEQQRDDADWDPEDVRYNTFRWITANAGFAMGPSRVNPMTGQILDADIIFDADFLQSWKQQYETLTVADAKALFNHEDPDVTPVGKLFGMHSHDGHACRLCQGMQRQMGFAASTMLMRGEVAAGKGVPDELIAQGLKEVVMHEVGHTLGLRHNFKASTWKTLAEMSDPAKAHEPTVASVMDYSPANIAPKGQPQGPYYTQTLGPYDYWAIEYGYKVIAGNETDELKAIAARSAEPGLDYLTDEDTRGITDSDPLSNRFDLGKDPIEYAKRQIATVTELMPKVVERAVADGEGYQRARQAFGLLLSQYWQTVSFVSRIPGGIHTHRDHKGTPNSRVPFVAVESAKQREAMKYLGEVAFNNQNFPPEVLNYLASTRWSHWGINSPTRLDYAIHDTVANMQERVISQLLSPKVMHRLRDGEIKAPAEADVYTQAEHLRLLTEILFTEIREAAKPGDYTNRKPYINSFRRNLQRIALVRYASLVTDPQNGMPEDVRTLARMHLTDLEKQTTTLLTAAGLNLDDYTKAHLLDTQERIRKALSQQVVTTSID